MVALFRHGVRAPLKDIDDPKKPYARNPWPNQAEWGVQGWGDLTPQGIALARALGRDYAENYKKTWRDGFKSFLWADLESRTCVTAEALKDGFKDGGISATVRYLSESTDPLFHSFDAHCGTPDPVRLRAIAAYYGANAQSWIESKYAGQFRQFYDVLACTHPKQQHCDPLKPVKDTVDACLSPATAPPPTPTPCSAPIKWHGQFPYANTASETFLLEYANKMVVGWGQVFEKPPHDAGKLLSMMALHDFYFDQMQREWYLAQIEASNLIREINQTLNDEHPPCGRIPAGYQFAALIGHDTNIASVASLLKLSWQFTGAPAGTRGLPDNDPLPAGALVLSCGPSGMSPLCAYFM